MTTINGFSGRVMGATGATRATWGAVILSQLPKLTLLRQRGFLLGTLTEFLLKFGVALILIFHFASIRNWIGAGGEWTGVDGTRKVTER